MTWIPCTEKLPAMDERVLVCSTTDRVSINERANIFGKWYWTNDEGLFIEPEDITHWQPLPTPPTRLTLQPT